MKRSVGQFIIKVIVTFIAYGVCLWSFNAIFDKEYGLDGVIIQSAFFSIIWTILVTWSERKKKSRK